MTDKNIEGKWLHTNIEIANFMSGSGGFYSKDNEVKPDFGELGKKDL